MFRHPFWNSSWKSRTRCIYRVTVTDDYNKRRLTISRFERFTHYGYNTQYIVCRRQWSIRSVLEILVRYFLSLTRDRECLIIVKSLDRDRKTDPLTCQGQCHRNLWNDTSRTSVYGVYFALVLTNEYGPTIFFRVHVAIGYDSPNEFFMVVLLPRPLVCGQNIFFRRNVIMFFNVYSCKKIVINRVRFKLFLHL